MSRFFRRGSSSSSSSSGSEDDNSAISIAQSQLVLSEGSIAAPAIFRSNNELRLSDNAIRERAGHRDILLHALLEERCLRQARDQLGSDASIAHVERHAQYQYHTLSDRLAAYGLVEPGLDNATFRQARDRVRDGLDVLSGTQASSGHTTDLTLQRNMNSGQSVHGLEVDFNTLQLFRPEVDLPQSIGLPFVDTFLGNNLSLVPRSADFLVGSRYHREFEELGMLGRGGYGMVFQCKHRIDGLSYAVKKVPLSANKLQRIREQGQAEIDRLLLELTTLARLDHPNIVRYFGGWIEFTTLQLTAPLHSGDDATFGASEQSSIVSTSWRPVANIDDAEYITFETSSSRNDTATLDSSQNSIRTPLQRYTTQDTQPTVSDEDVESISRSSSASADHSTLSALAQDPTPCLALHIQMGLYPFTLADYISRNASDTHAKHCFHLEPALRILAALIDGVTYLHSQAIVHRDLKPANVFLAQQQQKQGWCHKCPGANSDGVRIRIGDFGLVAAIAQQENDAATPVGTELYRPQNSVDRFRLEALDWFAIGMMAFELLWPFPTRMERHETLMALKSGLYPQAFAQQFGEESRDLIDLFDYLLRSSHLVDSEELQSMLASLMMKCYNHDACM